MDIKVSDVDNGYTLIVDQQDRHIFRIYKNTEEVQLLEYVGKLLLNQRVEVLIK